MDYPFPAGAESACLGPPGSMRLSPIFLRVGARTTGADTARSFTLRVLPPGWAGGVRPPPARTRAGARVLRHASR